MLSLTPSSTESKPSQNIRECQTVNEQTHSQRCSNNSFNSVRDYYNSLVEYTIKRKKENRRHWYRGVFFDDEWESAQIKEPVQYNSGKINDITILPDNNSIQFNSFDQQNYTFTYAQQTKEAPHLPSRFLIGHSPTFYSEVTDDDFLIPLINDNTSKDPIESTAHPDFIDDVPSQGGSDTNSFPYLTKTRANEFSIFRAHRRVCDKVHTNLLLNILRILQKIVKSSPPRLHWLKYFNGPVVIGYCLSSQIPSIRFITLKLLKQLYRYMDEKWKKENIHLLSLIYFSVPVSLGDAWHISFYHPTKEEQQSQERGGLQLKKYVDKFIEDNFHSVICI